MVRVERQELGFPILIPKDKYIACDELNLPNEMTKPNAKLPNDKRSHI